MLIAGLGIWLASFLYSGRKRHWDIGEQMLFPSVVVFVAFFVHQLIGRI